MFVQRMRLSLVINALIACSLMLAVCGFIHASSASASDGEFDAYPEITKRRVLEPYVSTPIRGPGFGADPEPLLFTVLIDGRERLPLATDEAGCLVIYGARSVTVIVNGCDDESLVADAFTPNRGHRVALRWTFRPGRFGTVSVDAAGLAH